MLSQLLGTEAVYPEDVRPRLRGREAAVIDINLKYFLGFIRKYLDFKLLMHHWLVESRKIDIWNMTKLRAACWANPNPMKPLLDSLAPLSGLVEVIACSLSKTILTKQMNVEIVDC